MLNIIPWDAVFILINLIVLYIIMRKVLIKPINNIINERRTVIESGLEKAAASESNAKALEKEWREKLSKAGAESESIIETAKETARGEYDKLVAEANTEAARILRDARKSIEDERNSAMQGIRSQVASLAVDAAKKVLESSDLSDINDSIYEKFLTGSGDGNESESK